MAQAIDWTISLSLIVRPLGKRDLKLFDAHFRRHRGESGRGDVHFMPFAPDDPKGPNGLELSRVTQSCNEPMWERWWVLCTEVGEIVGHVDLKGDHLVTGLHHCELGIGIERTYRGQGNGQRLMQVAIAFAQAQPQLDWLDLRVFAHNLRARTLYKQFGFSEVAVLEDRFRIEGERLDDVLMTLFVGSN